ncbi:endonuclease domain-containing protein [Leucobacter sp. NPDC058333]|uniref:endonuclease domain-containing protein n=1 Tax=Leucobacter sp. NPDC058333 TaxID=3346450 RepID=UPI00365712C2
MRKLSPIPHLTADPKTVHDLLAAGTPRWRLHAADVERPIHGVVMRQHNLPATSKLYLGLALKLHRGQFFTRRTAARMHAMPVARTSDDRIELGAIRPSRPLRRPQTTGHQLRPGALGRIPETSPWLPSIPDTWCLLAQVAGRAELLAAGDWAISGVSRFDRPPSTRRGLVAAAARFAGTNGTELRREILPLIRVGAESPAESELRLVLADAGLPEPTIQCPVRVAGRTLHADLGYPALKIAIEYEGAYHFGSDAVEQARRDITRVRAMEAAGWRVFRVTSHDLRNPTALIRELLAAIDAAERVSEE